MAMVGWMGEQPMSPTLISKTLAGSSAAWRMEVEEMNTISSEMRSWIM